MRRTRRSAALVGVWLLAAGCWGGGGDGGPAAVSERAAERRVEAEMAHARTRIVARAESVAAKLETVRPLTSAERRRLRRDVNAKQVATARRLGVRPGSEARLSALVRAGRLVPLGDSTGYWVVRELDYSAPYVTPDAKAMLEEIGRRFQARLDSLGLPHYRLEVTSVMRTPGNQAALREVNVNAARTASAHEFGTTLDVAYTHFAAPPIDRLTVRVPTAPAATSPMRQVEGLALEEAARRQAPALQAALGRVLERMRAEGKLEVMMERRQAVYHMTVAHRFPRATAVE